MEATNDADVLGPVDYLVVEFPRERANFTGAIRAELKQLVDQQLIRVLAQLILRKNPDGSLEADEMQEADRSDVGDTLADASDVALLLAEDDVVAVGNTLTPGSAAAIIVYE